MNDYPMMNPINPQMMSSMSAVGPFDTPYSRAQKQKFMAMMLSQPQQDPLSVPLDGFEYGGQKNVDAPITGINQQAILERENAPIAGMDTILGARSVTPGNALAQALAAFGSRAIGDRKNAKDAQALKQAIQAEENRKAAMAGAELEKEESRYQQEQARQRQLDAMEAKKLETEQLRYEDEQERLNRPEELGTPGTYVDPLSGESITVRPSVDGTGTMVNTATGQPVDLTGYMSEKEYNARSKGGNSGSGDRLDPEFSKKIAARLDSSFEESQDKVNSLNSINNAYQLLEEGIRTGTLAEPRQYFGRALKTLGFNYSDDETTNTDIYVAESAKRVASIITAFGAGTGLSNEDRVYALKAAGGDIELDKDALFKILRLTEQADRYMLSRHNKLLERLPEAGRSAIGEFYNVEAPPSYYGDIPEGFTFDQWRALPKEDRDDLLRTQ